MNRRKEYSHIPAGCEEVGLKHQRLRRYPGFDTSVRLPSSLEWLEVPLLRPIFLPVKSAKCLACLLMLVYWSTLYGGAV